MRTDSTRRWRVDFSLALFNRSGKYQIGRELLDRHADLVDSIWYWRQAARDVPGGLRARLLGRGEKLERDLRLALGGLRPARPAGLHRWLHLDPLTVSHRLPGHDDIVLVHDMGPLTHPHLFPAGTRQAYEFAFGITRDCDPRLVFVSKDTQRRYAEMYGAPSRGTVIYPPIATRLHGGDLKKPDGVGEKFVLTVGAIGSRKNQARTIAAFAASGLAAEGYHYVLCGSREPGYEEVAAAAAATPQVQLLSFVEDAELRWLYANASSFVLASLLEGFGMPVAEAMAFGLVPVVSRDSVLEEVAGHSALAVDPADTGAIATALNEAVSIPDDELDRRRRAMQARIASFSEENFHRNWHDLLATGRA